MLVAERCPDVPFPDHDPAKVVASLRAITTSTYYRDQDGNVVEEEDEDEEDGKSYGPRVELNRSCNGITLSGFNLIGKFKLGAGLPTLEIRPQNALDKTEEEAWRTVLDMDAAVSMALKTRSLIRIHDDDLAESLASAYHQRPSVRLLRLYAEHFADAVTEALAAGLPVSYTEASEQLEQLRGRPNFERAVDDGGRDIPMWCTFESLNEDHLLNRTIRYATLVLGAKLLNVEDKEAAPVVSRLEGIFGNMASVTPEIEELVSLEAVAEAEAHWGGVYGRALRWAVLLIPLTITSEGDETWIPSAGFSLSMDQLGERWFGVKLMESFPDTDPEPPGGAEPTLLVRMKRLGWRKAAYRVPPSEFLNVSTTKQLKVNPDFMITKESGIPALVMDFKNKGLKGKVPRHDLEQMSFFMDACGAPGVIIYSDRARTKPKQDYFEFKSYGEGGIRTKRIFVTVLTAFSEEAFKSCMEKIVVWAESIRALEQRRQINPRAQDQGPPQDP